MSKLNQGIVEEEHRWQAEVAGDANRTMCMCSDILRYTSNAFSMASNIKVAMPFVYCIQDHEHRGLAQDQWKAARCATLILLGDQSASVDCGICCTERALTQYYQDQVATLTRKGMSL